MVVPGKYRVSLAKFDKGQLTELVPAQAFNCKPLKAASLPEPDNKKLDEFNRRVAELVRAITGADAYRGELVDKIPYLKKAVTETGKLPQDTYQTVLSIEEKLKVLNRKLNGDQLRATYESAAPTSLRGKVETVTGSLWSTTSEPTTTFYHLYDVAADQFGEILVSLKTIGEEVKRVETDLEKYGAPHTPGRLPEWKKN